MERLDLTLDRFCALSGLTRRGESPDNTPKTCATLASCERYYGLICQARECAIPSHERDARAGEHGKAEESGVHGLVGFAARRVCLAASPADAASLTGVRDAAYAWPAGRGRRWRHRGQGDDGVPS